MASVDVTVLLVALQGLLGVLIAAGGVVLLAMGTDRHSRFTHRVLVVGLVLWGVWFAWLAWQGRHDSPPALAMAACVAMVVLSNGRQIRGILDGEPWWPPHSVDPRALNHRGR